MKTVHRANQLRNHARNHLLHGRYRKALDCGKKAHSLHKTQFGSFIVLLASHALQIEETASRQEMDRLYYFWKKLLEHVSFIKNVNMELDQKTFDEIAGMLASDESPVGIDDKKTNVYILQKLNQIEERFDRLEKKQESNI